MVGINTLLSWAVLSQSSHGISVGVLGIIQLQRLLVRAHGFNGLGNNFLDLVMVVEKEENSFNLGIACLCLHELNLKIH